jgi:mannose-6-phosphate isomerase
MIIKFKPIFFDKVWGGSDFKRLYGYDTNDQCGEAWGISAHRNGSSVVRNTKYKGMSLKDLFDQEKHLFGQYEKDEFPILVKLISAKQNLSVQVHPNNEQAKKYNSLGKEECWTILDHKKEVEILIGHKATTKQAWIDAIEHHSVESLLNHYPISKGDIFYISAGTVHAICAGTTLLEVQQSSDITYRLYDYNRLHNGTLRKLHIEEGLEALTIPDSDIIRRPKDTYFKYALEEVTSSKTYQADQHGDYIFIMSGEGHFNDEPVKAGDFLMVPSLEHYDVVGHLTFQKTQF